ncbi:hypothetical protein [Burkholderia sp. 572]|uniref:hypothetical protein n=1 Tax=Burkholderia sp. 572 TaxID=3156414 RepID=UPI00339A58BA
MDTDERICDVRRKSGAWTPLYDRPALSAIPAGWMLVPRNRGTKPLAELIIAASLACVENRLMDDDDRREFAQFADQLQHAPQPPYADAAAAQADERPKPSLIASTKTINAVSAALDAVREYANSQVADQMNRAVNMLLDELGQARAAASQPAAAAGQEAAVYQILTEEGAWLDVPHKIYERKKSDPALTRVVYTAPPAQVATRQLTDEQRKSIWWAVLTAEADEPTPGSLMHRRAQDLRALLEGAKR